ncbi:hypothetical protein AQ490_17475 [Wenjunlia vitaminophila]|uniref:DUF8129 domain-containing protein n=1 Tax=Wenjunlia vitaminophila TaxID=76728 RepID=A0A0T6LV40_WENVI|nr:hypothetical protein [Wenjunlia vitaminophila]KRV50019.1 hypothetical protein AQ490_17475 [Wenjunlia vitaminophila]
MSERENLPIPDYDHLPVGSLRHRIRSLGRDDLERLLDYERAHGDRLPVVQAMSARLAELAAGAVPSGGTPDAPAPEHPPGPDATSKVSPSTRGPALTPPSHGTPENPTQPRKTG